MSITDQQVALQLATNTAKGDDILPTARAYLRFLTGTEPPEPTAAELNQPGKRQGNRHTKAEKERLAAEAPKVLDAAPLPAETPEVAAQKIAHHVEPTKPAAEENWEDPTPPKEEAPKKLSVDDVRAKFVELQSLVGKKEPVLAILQKLTNGGNTLGTLKETQYAEAIAAADFEIRKHKKAAA